MLFKLNQGDAGAGRPHTLTMFLAAGVLSVLAILAMLALAVPEAGAKKKSGKRKAAAPTFIYGLCGPNVCKVNAKTRKMRIALRRSSGKEYTSISASASGSTLAFVYDGDVYRSGRDGRGRRKLDQGGWAPRAVAVSPNGRNVGWFANLSTQQCLPDLWGGTINCYPVTYTYLYKQGLTDRESESITRSANTFGWYRNQPVIEEEPDEGEADFICQANMDGDCVRTLARDPNRAYSSPVVSPDGRYLAVVSEPVPPENGDMDFVGRIEIFNAANGRKIRNLTNGRKDANPVFSPDGKSVAYNRGKDVLALSVKGKKPRLIKRGLTLTGPSWAKGR